jgi:hypothetical protein
MASPYFPQIPTPVYQRCLQISINADTAWTTLVRIIRAENIALGITNSGKTKLIADTLFPVMVYGSSGSLWEAYNALEQIVVTPEMSPFITKDRLEWMKNQLIQVISSL